MKRDGVDRLKLEVNRIIDSRYKRKKLHYKVLWEGGFQTEEPWTNVLPGSEELVADFHLQYPNKPGPPSSFKQMAEQVQEQANKHSQELIQGGGGSVINEAIHAIHKAEVLPLPRTSGLYS